MAAPADIPGKDDIEYIRSRGIKLPKIREILRGAHPSRPCARTLTKGSRPTR